MPKATTSKSKRVFISDWIDAYDCTNGDKPFFDFVFIDGQRNK